MTTPALQATPGFDYLCLAGDVAEDVRRCAARLHELNKRQRFLIVEIGKELIAAKERLGHGQWLPWLEAEFAWSDRTARSYMQVAQAFGAKSEIVSVLPPTTLYKLAAPSTPSHVRDVVVGQLEIGASPSTRDIEKLIKTTRAEYDEAHRTAHQSPKERRKEAEKVRRQRARRRRHEKAWADEQAAFEKLRQTQSETANRAVAILKDRLGSEFIAIMRLILESDTLFNSAVKRAIFAHDGQLRLEALDPALRNDLVSHGTS